MKGRVYGAPTSPPRVNPELQDLQELRHQLAEMQQQMATGSRGDSEFEFDVIKNELARLRSTLSQPMAAPRQP